MHYYPFYSPFASTLFLAFVPLIIILVIWTVAIKGYALWHAARSGQKEWFIALLILNTLGILEVVYLIWFRKNNHHSHAHPSAVHSSSQG